MAVVATEAINIGYEVSLAKIRVTKGNGLTDLITETFDGKSFAATEFGPIPVGAGTAGDNATVKVSKSGMGLGKGALAVRVSKQIAALGARGDYISFEFDTTAQTSSTWAGLVRGFMVEALDYSGVPVAVQHAIFGKYSPFVTPTQPVSRGMIQGIDRQEVELVHNIAATADGAEKTQYIRGASDSRLVAIATGATAAVTKLTLKVKPNSDGVFVIPRGAVIWGGIGEAATKVVTMT